MLIPFKKKLSRWMFLLSKEYRELAANFRKMQHPKDTFARLERALENFGYAEQLVLKRRLNEFSWPFVLTEHGFNRSMASFESRVVWNQVTEVTRMFTNAGYQVFVTNGTLLGLVREGGFLKFDDDLDMAVYFPGADDHEMAKRVSDLASEFSKLNWSRHHFHKTFHQAVRLESGVTLDVFPIWQLDERTLVPYPTGPLSVSDLFPTNLRLVDGVEIPIPADPEKVLQSLYGSGWKQEDLSFRFDWSKGAPHYQSYRRFCLDYRAISP